MATPTITVNIVVTAQGAQPTAPATLFANMITLTAAFNPGYTILPAALIEDLASTGTFNLALCDSAGVELINSLNPATANPWLLIQLGNIYGVPQGQDTNGSVFVVFSSNSPGFQIGMGWVVSDGVNQYVVQDGAVIQGDGQSIPTFCVASQPGTFAIPANAVNQTVTQPPAGSGITVTVNNPTTGTPSAGAQTEYQYRAAVLQAGLVTGQGAPSMAKTLLGNVPGVQPRTIATPVVSGQGWMVVCGGGDPYNVANAIYAAGIDISTLVGSRTVITGVTQANPGVATTNLFHGLTTGESVTIADATGMTAINGTWTATVISPTQFSFGLNTTSDPAYTGGGVPTPNSGNARNVVVDLISWPDTYPVTFVTPLAMAATIQLTYDSVSPNVVSESAVQQLGAPAIAAYLNGLPTGAPINLNAMGAVFTAAVQSLFGGNIGLISALDWTVSVLGFELTPEAGTFLIYGDPQGFFTASTAAVTIAQG
jgi:Ubiquitin-activating enzyme E1 FCCH domain